MDNSRERAQAVIRGLLKERQGNSNDGLTLLSTEQPMWGLKNGGSFPGSHVLSINIRSLRHLLKILNLSIANFKDKLHKGGKNQASSPA